MLFELMFYHLISSKGPNKSLWIKDVTSTGVQIVLSGQVFFGNFTNPHPHPSSLSDI